MRSIFLASMCGLGLLFGNAPEGKAGSWTDWAKDTADWAADTACQRLCPTYYADLYYGKYDLSPDVLAKAKGLVSTAGYNFDSIPLEKINSLIQPAMRIALTGCFPTCQNPKAAGPLSRALARYITADPSNPSNDFICQNATPSAFTEVADACKARG